MPKGSPVKCTTINGPSKVSYPNASSLQMGIYEHTQHFETLHLALHRMKRTSSKKQSQQMIWSLFEKLEKRWTKVLYTYNKQVHRMVSIPGSSNFNRGRSRTRRERVRLVREQAKSSTPFCRSREVGAASIIPQSTQVPSTTPDDRRSRRLPIQHLRLHCLC